VPGTGTDAAAGLDDPARLDLVDLAPVVGALPGIDAVAWRATITHLGGPTDATWDRVDVAAELRAPVTTRSALRAALAGADVTPLLRRRSVALDPRTLAPGEQGVAEGAVPLQGLAPAGEPGDVHPLRLRVIADGVEVARLDTAVVRMTTAPAETLATALVQPLSHPPLLATGDTESDAAALTALAAAIAPGGPLGAAVATLASADPTVAAAVTLAPAAHLLEDLAALAAADPDAVAAAAPDAPADAAAMLATLRTLAATGRSGPVVTAYAGADLARLTAAAGPVPADADDDARAAAEAAGAAVARIAAASAFEGGRRLLPLLGRAPVPVTLVDGTTTRRALDLVDGTVLLPHAALDLPDPDLDPTLGEPVRRVSAASGRIVTAVVADPFLAEALAGTDRAALAARQGGPVAAAQEVLVRSALVFLQAPGRGDRGLLLVLPSTSEPDPVALGEVLSRVGGASWLALVGPATLAARAGATAAPRASLRQAEVAPAPRLAAALTGADAALRRALATIDAPDGPPELGGSSPAALDGVLLRAAGLASAAATPDAADRALTAIAAVRAAADGALGPVAVAAADLTLTDRTGPLPLSVANGGALPLRVAVEVVGPAGLGWPEGTRRELLLPAGGEVALELPVAARGTGTFPVVVRVLDATDGELAAVSIAVRSTAVAGPALVGIAAAVVVMTAVGLVRQRRRGRRPAA
jgi:hypothetical protein